MKQQRRDDENLEADAPKRGRGRPSKYQPLYAELIVSYFRRAQREVEEVERSQSRDGIKYTLKPVLPPTLGGFASRIRVSRETLWRWGAEHEEFGDALDQAKAIAEDLYVKMSALGCYPAGFASFLLKNAIGWKDKSELALEGGPLVLRFDEQDRDA